MKLIEARTDYLASLDELKAELGIVDADETEDTRLTDLLNQATDVVEGDTGYNLTPQSYVLTFPKFAPVMDMVYYPVQTVEISYYDETNTLIDLNASQFDASDLPGRVVVFPINRWPRTICRPDAVIVTVLTGWGGDDPIEPIYKMLTLAKAKELDGNAEAGKVYDKHLANATRRW